jgi:hypothetical protein
LLVTLTNTHSYAAQRLLDLDFSGKQTRDLLGERDLTMVEATAVIARGIGRPICVTSSFRTTKWSRY